LGGGLYISQANAQTGFVGSVLVQSNE